MLSSGLTEVCMQYFSNTKFHVIPRQSSSHSSYNCLLWTSHLSIWLWSIQYFLFVNPVNLVHAFAGSEKEGFRITVEFIEQMLEEFREQRKIHVRYALHIVLSVSLLTQTETKLQPISLSFWIFDCQMLYKILKFLVLITLHVDVIFSENCFWSSEWARQRYHIIAMSMSRKMLWRFPTFSLLLGAHNGFHLSL